MTTGETCDRCCEVSVVVSTYNRATRLPLALDALFSQVGDVPYEIIVVDNNSSDGTADVVARMIAAGARRLRYVFEPRQGLSYGRNTGISLARGSIVALTDDDVRVATDWVQQLKETFDRHPEIDYIGGRVLPNWLELPPRWLTQAHWAPLALQDYGSQPLACGRERAICLVGANLAFRRQVFDSVGLFAPALGRVKDGIGSTEDHDMQLRIWRAGMGGLYVPELIATADVTPDRLSKAYHRRWHQGHGRHCALMRLRELVPSDLGPMTEPNDIVPLFGSPAFVYADVLGAAFNWVRALVRRGDSRFYLHQLCHLSSYIRTSSKLIATEHRDSVPAELFRFVRAYVHKRRPHLNRAIHN